MTTIRKIIIWSIVIGAIVSLIVAFFVHYGNLRDELVETKQQNIVLEKSIETQQTVIDQMKTDIEEVKNINQNITKQNNNLKRDVESLNSKFSKRDFGSLATQRPQTIQRLINRASENVARCFELASGAPLTDAEKNAKTPLEANNECPNLVTNSINNNSN
jgi:predicted RNase H-like nuclease (RuvC/YqgF family)